MIEENKNDELQEDDSLEDCQSETDIDTPKQKYHFKKKDYIYLGIILSILMIGYGFGCFYYSDKFMPQTTLYNINVSGLSAHKAAEKLQKNIPDQSLTLTFIDGKTEELTTKDCGMTFQADNDIEKIIKEQNVFLWFTHWFSPSHIEIEHLLDIDETKINASITKLLHLQKDQQIAPVDAKVEYKDQKFTITKEIIGNTISSDVLKENIIQAFQEGKTEINVKDVGGYTQPKITSDDKSLEKLLDAANKYCHVSITYKTTTDNVILDGNTLMTWLSIDESGNYYKDDQEFQKQATAFVKDLASQINIIGKKITFTGVNGRRSVSNGNYGYKLNQEKETKGLLKDIADGKNGVRAPITTGVQASYENGGLGDTFIEIDMTKQHFWYHKSGKIILESDVVTGLPSDPNKKTPAGAYYIYFKQLDRTLRGEIQADGKPEYETPVSYWMAFNGGIGLHDASWQSRFGGKVYYTRGSHGCINLPIDVAGTLYDMIKVNTPVVCYY